MWITYYDGFRETFSINFRCDGTDISEHIDLEVRVHIQSIVPTFQNVAHKGWKYLPIIGHVFHRITHFSCQILSFIHAFAHTNGLKVDYIYELGFFSQILGAKGGVDYTPMRLIEDCYGI